MAKLQTLTINDTGSLVLPSGLSSQRPNQASTLTSFTAVGSTTWTCPPGVTSIELLVVGGGGGGAWGNTLADGNGGGGGGGVVYQPSFPVVPGTGYTVVVGGGGAAGTGVPASRGGTGGNSQFGTITAFGGGGGGSDSGVQNGLTGGSGGGASTSGAGGIGGAGTTNQGFPGGRADQPGGGGPGGGGGGGGGAGGLGVGGVGASRTPNPLAGSAGATNYGGGGGAGTATYAGGAGGSGVVHLRYNTNDTIGYTTAALRYNPLTGIEYSAGGETSAGFTTYGRHNRYFLPFLTRTIITNAYVAGGYKDGVPWRNVNRTVCATDVTTNLGDQLSTQTNYKPGGCSKNIGYAFGATASNAAASNFICAFNMNTEISYTIAGSTTLTSSATTNGACFKEHYKSYIHGGGNYAQIDEYNMMTETTVGHVATIMQEASWAMSHETFGLFYGSDSNTRAFHFAVNTAVTRSGTHPSAHHQQKSVQSKLVFCYAGNEGTYLGGNNFRKTNMISDTTSGTIAKPITNSGEENFTLGQHHQYMLGMYNGLQNNLSWKFNYASETGASVGATTEPKGQAGMSSAICFWRE